jgi:hypothetical protein
MEKRQGLSSRMSKWAGERNERKLRLYRRDGDMKIFFSKTSFDENKDLHVLSRKAKP